jgi:hypothetical protein
MSQENPEFVRKVDERWSEGDFRASADLLDPHVLLLLHSLLHEAGTYLGGEAVAEYTRDLLEGFHAPHAGGGGDHRGGRQCGGHLFKSPVRQHDGPLGRWWRVEPGPG